jgi:CHASE2 domain-containing sensor protein
MDKVILNLSKNNLTNTIPVTVQIWDWQGRLGMKQEGSLPPQIEIEEMYERWQSLYIAYYQDLDAKNRLDIFDDDDDESIFFCQEEFELLCQKIPLALNQWLDSPSFAEIKWKLATHLDRDREFQVIIETENKFLRKLPWHLWNFFQDYPRADFGLSLPNYEKITISEQKSSSFLKILAILGNPYSQKGEKLDLETDRLLISNLPNTQVQFLEEPTPKTLKNSLWEGNWHILFFAGHTWSQDSGETGWLNLNNHTLTLAELEAGLKTARTKGLQIAIFNSCDGLGLAWHLAKLNIPATIVMKEGIPDEVAQEFLKYFLSAFTNGKSLHLAVKEARQRIKENLEPTYPCASWLPTICQNPAFDLPNWHNLFLPPSPLKQSNANQKLILKALLVTIAIALIRSLGWLQSYELKALDLLLKTQSSEARDERFLLITISEEDIQYQETQGMLRRDSLSDLALDRVLETIQKYQPIAIGLDIYHDYQFTSQLSDRLATIPNFIAVCEIGQTEQNNTSIASPPGISIDNLGFTDLPRDPDDVLRRQLIFMDSNFSCNTQQSFSWRMAWEYLSQQGFALNYTKTGQLQLGNKVFPRLPANGGGYQLPPDEALGYQVLINYRRADFPQISLRDFLNRSGDARIADLIANKIILIGVNSSNKDSHLTPLIKGSWSLKVPGIVVQAQGISQIISAVQNNRPILWWLPEVGEILIIAISSSIGTILSIWNKMLLPKLKKGRNFISIILAISFLISICYFALSQGLWLPLIPSILSFLGGYFTIKSRKSN